MKIMSNEEFVDLTKDRSKFLSSLAKSRFRKEPGGHVDTGDLKVISSMCRGSGYFRDTKWVEALYLMGTSGKLQEILEGKMAREDRLVHLNKLNAQKKLKFAINESVIVKDNGKHGSVVDYNTDTKAYLVVFNPFEVGEFKDSDLIKTNN